MPKITFVPRRDNGPLGVKTKKTKNRKKIQGTNCNATNPRVWTSSLESTLLHFFQLVLGGAYRFCSSSYLGLFVSLSFVEFVGPFNLGLMSSLNEPIKPSEPSNLQSNLSSLSECGLNFMLSCVALVAWISSCCVWIYLDFASDCLIVPRCCTPFLLVSSHFVFLSSLFVGVNFWRISRISTRLTLL